MTKNVDLSLEGTLSRVMPKLVEKDNVVGCEYCKSDKNAGLNNEYNSNFSMGILNIDNEPVINVYFDNGNIVEDDNSFVINFCPMCGRKLVED